MTTRINKKQIIRNDKRLHQTLEDNNILRFVMLSWSSLEPPQDEKYIITGTLS